MRSTLCRIFRLAPLSGMLFAVLVLAPDIVPAQAHTPVFDATMLRQPSNLDATWLVHGGDDMAYARPGFDDSHWTPFDPHTDLRNLFHPPYPQVVWYRLHVKVNPAQKELALEEWALSRAFEIYANGQLLIRSGNIEPFEAGTLTGRVVRAMPDAALADGSVVIALRIRIAPAEWTAGYPGLYYYNLLIGQESALKQQAWLNVIGTNAATWLYNIIGFGIALVALALFRDQPSHKEYLWIALSFFLSAATLPFLAIESFQNVSATVDLMRSPIIAAQVLCTVLMYLSFIQPRIPRWIKVMLAAAAAGIIVGTPLSTMGISSSLTDLLDIVPALALMAGVVPFLLLIHWRRGNREAGILLIPCLLFSLTVYFNVIVGITQAFPATTPFGLRLANLTNLPLGPFTLNIGQIGNFVMELALVLIIVRRATRISRQQALLESELEAARQVQQVIQPEQVDTIPGFAIESVYLPAQQVGGDFFQVVPIAGGGLLLVLGDVAGKGLPAAMLVSVIVGAIRAAAQYTTDPSEILANLNDRLVGRANGAFSTALALRIHPDGRAVLANAGHLPPYIDGREIEIDGALPLGVQQGTEYPTVQFDLAKGSRLTFYSDGVVEAQNGHQELFGFDRSREMSTRSAVDVAEAAQRFGQQDDITVVAIAREPVAMPIPA